MRARGILQSTYLYSTVFVANCCVRMDGIDEGSMKGCEKWKALRVVNFSLLRRTLYLIQWGGREVQSCLSGGFVRSAALFTRCSRLFTHTRTCSRNSRIFTHTYIFSSSRLSAFCTSPEQLCYNLEHYCKFSHHLVRFGTFWLRFRHLYGIVPILIELYGNVCQGIRGYILVQKPTETYKYWKNLFFVSKNFLPKRTETCGNVPKRTKMYVNVREYTGL